MDRKQPIQVSSLNTLFELLARVDRHLLEHSVAWALVGGLAVGARTEPRFTRDLDLVVAVDSDTEAEQLIMALRSQGYQINMVIEQVKTGRLATVRLLPEGDGRLVDLLFASTGIEAEIVRRADPLEVAPGYKFPVASLGDLIAMKHLSRNDLTRPQDRVDLVVLLKTASDGDLRTAREALQEMVSKGTHRGRPLVDEFEAALQDLRQPPGA